MAKSGIRGAETGEAIDKKFCRPSVSQDVMTLANFGAYRLSFTASCTSYVCLNSRVCCRMCVLTVVCFIFKFVWHHRYLGHATNFFSRIVTQFCVSVSIMQPVWKLLNWLFEQIQICLSQRRIIVLFRMYPPLFCLGSVGMLFWH